MPAPAITDLDALIMCLTCGFQPDGGRGLVVHEDAGWNEHGHADSAHMPHWALDPDSGYELVDVASLVEGDVLGADETVHAIYHVTDPIEDWSDTEDGHPHRPAHRQGRLARGFQDRPPHATLTTASRTAPSTRRHPRHVRPVADVRPDARAPRCTGRRVVQRVPRRSARRASQRTRPRQYGRPTLAR
jgi:hypothetical protein